MSTNTTPDSTNDGNNNSVAKKKSTSNIPQSDIDLGTVSRLAANKWAVSPGFTLIYKTPPQFDTDVQLYEDNLQQRLNQGGTRPATTQSLKALDATIDARTETVKGYLEEKYTKQTAPAHFAAFGIVKSGTNYKLPKDRNNRVAALNLMVSAIGTEGFGTNTYGTTFWTNIRTDYQTALGVATSTDSIVSTRVATKKTQKKEIKKVLNSLIHIIKGNYPDTWKGELRAWGFQKEKY